MKRPVIILAALFITLPLSGLFLHANAQIGNTGDLLRASLADAETITAEYIRPYAEGLGSVANSGWVYSARAHSVLGFSLSLRTGIAVVPPGLDTFDLNNLDLTSLRPVNSANSITPSVSGPNNTGPQVVVVQTNPATGQDVIVTSFDMPSGTGFGYVPAFAVQGGLGLPYDTEIMVRFIPNINIRGYGEFGMFGLGFIHELNQWIPAYLPVDISLMAGYMNIGLTGSYTLAPTASEYDSDPNNLDTPARWAGQEAVLSSNSWNANVMAGRTLGPVSFYGGLGMQSTEMNLDFTGEYPVYDLEVNQQGETSIVLSSMTDPLTVTVNTGNVFRTFAGATVKLGLVYFSAEVTYAEYAVLNAGLGIAFR